MARRRPRGRPKPGGRGGRGGKKDQGKSLRVNERIRISPVRLIDENNEQVGVLETDEARKKARGSGMDLVEVAPNERPPVCRIMDYGKWKYAQRKKEQKAKANAKQSELKGVRLRPKIDEHDLSIKVDQARKFLGGGDKVQFQMLFRGREVRHRDLGFDQMHEIAESLEDVSKVESEPRMMGKRLTMVLSPEQAPKSGKGGNPEQPPATAPEPQQVGAV